MENSTESDYWNKYDMITGSYLFARDQLREKHSQGEITIDELINKMGEANQKYKKEMKLVTNIIGVCIRN